MWSPRKSCPNVWPSHTDAILLFKALLGGCFSVLWPSGCHIQNEAFASSSALKTGSCPFEIPIPERGKGWVLGLHPSVLAIAGLGAGYELSFPICSLWSFLPGLFSMPFAFLFSPCWLQLLYCIKKSYLSLLSRFTVIYTLLTTSH